MGFIEDIEARTDLSDEIKASIIAAHKGEVDPLKAKSRRETVEGEVTQLSNLGFSEAPGLLKFVRRVFLSDDEEPGVVLLSDNEMGLSGDLSTGATGREEMTVAGAIRKFIDLLPVNAEGKLNLSDQVNAADNHGRPDNGDGNESEEERVAKHDARVKRLTGSSVKRDRTKRYRQAMLTGGGE